MIMIKSRNVTLRLFIAIDAQTAEVKVDVNL